MLIVPDIPEATDNKGDDLLSPKGVGDMMVAFENETAGIRRDQLEAAQRPLPHKPHLQRAEVPPSANIGNDAMLWIAAATAFGGIAGAMTRNHTTNALAAFTGTLDGLKEGNQQKFENNYKTWEASARQIKQNNDAELAEYKQAIERRDLDERQRSIQIEITANKYRNQFMAATARHAAQTGDYPMVMASFDALTRQNDQGANAMEKLIQLREARQQRLEDFKDRERIKQQEKDRVTLSETAIDVYAKTQQLTGRLPPNVSNRLSPGDRAAIGNRYAELVGSGGANTEETIRNQAVFNGALKGDTASLTKLTNQYDAITSFENTAIKNMERLVTLAEKVDDTGMPLFEKWIRGGKKATGDQDVAQFDFQYRTTLPEVARILTQPNMTGVLSDSARTEVMDAMPKALSAQSFRDIFELAKADFYNRSKSIVDQYNQIQQRMKTGGGLPQPVPTSKLQMGDQPPPAQGGSATVGGVSHGLNLPPGWSIEEVK